MLRKSIFAYVAVVLLAGTMSSPGIAEQKFEPGELLVGYATPNDRDNAIKTLSGAKKTLRARGAPLDAIDVKPVSENAVRMRVTFPAAVLNATRNNPAEEIAVLQDLAKQLKDSDKSVRY